MIKNLGKTIKRVLTDGGGEYKKTTKYIEDEGIIWNNIQTYIPDINSASKRIGKELI